MAEFAQRGIEEMLVEVEKMRKIGLFSTEETRALMKKRKRFEYKMQRRTKEKEVYLQYIQYEIGVHQLIKLRREKRGIELGKDEVEKEIILRIYKLFRIACFRFKSDVKLWLTYADFAKKNFDKERVSKIYTTMLQTHNKKPNLWIIAAKFEFEVNESIETARSLFQRAIRFVPKNKKLWIEYFKMELLCVEVIMKRKELLGIKESESDEKPCEPISRVEDAILSCKIAEIIFQNSIEEFKEDAPEVINSFILVANQFNFTKNLIDQMYNRLMEDEILKKLTKTQDALARRHLIEETEILKKCEISGQIADFTIAELEEKTNNSFLQSLTVLNTQEMHLTYIDFLTERLNLNSQYLNDERFERLNNAFTKAETQFQIPIDYLVEWIRYMIRFKKNDDAIQIIEKYLTTFRDNKDLWTLYLQVFIAKDAKEDKLFEIFNKSIDHVKQNDALELWQIMLDWTLCNHSEKIEQLLQRGSSIMRLEISTLARLKYLEWAGNIGDGKLEEVYSNLRQVPPFSLEFYQKYIQMKYLKKNDREIQNAFEDALLHFGNASVDLWINYMDFKQKINKTQDISDLYWRAMKQLNSNLSEELTQKFCLFKTNIPEENIL